MFASIRKFTIALSVVIACLAIHIDAFAQFSAPHCSSRTSPAMLTVLQAREERNEPESSSVALNRRDALFGIVATTFGAAALGNPQEASARYSSYTHREQDWEERQKKGEINYKTPRDLKAELKEIAPMNTASSKIFCPNGPSAAVSPLMENRCGDKLAIPSVYGRTQDVVGNSIPGFAVGYRNSNLDLNSSGGFPSYK